MPPKKQKLELTWIGKENRPKLEPRILVEDPEKSYHARHRVKMGSHEVTKNTKESSNPTLHASVSSCENKIGDLFDNKLIFGDNLLALKALEQDYAGKVKCVFIDPPYNTGSAFEHYDDGVEHSLWLSLIRDRIVIIHALLNDEGSLFFGSQSTIMNVIISRFYATMYLVVQILLLPASGKRTKVVVAMRIFPFLTIIYWFTQRIERIGRLPEI